MSKWVIILSSILISMYAADGYKILLVSPLAVRSHAILAEGMIKYLKEAGHEITYISGYPYEKTIPNVNIVKVESDWNKNKKSNDIMNLTEYMNRRMDFYEYFKMTSMLANVSLNVIRDDNVQRLMMGKQQFDVAIVEWLWSDIYAAFGEVFNCPLIWFSSVEPHWKILRLVDESTNPAYTYDTFSANTPPFTFTQRVTELVFQIVGHFIGNFIFEPSERDVYNSYIEPVIRAKGREPASIEVIKYNASLTLGNSHVSLGLPTRLPDGYKSIGGYHIEKDVKPLPENLIKIFDKAEHGVIYFSMGTNLNSNTLPGEIKRSLLEKFGKLKQTVIWKFEGDLPNRPKNVYVLQWAPQQSILAHEKCVLFITHGGLLSTTEAVHFGVPIIGIPVFADQHTNVARAVQRGLARRVDLSYTMADSLYVEINEILSNSAYRQRVKELSLIYHDRPLSPGVELVYWVEHVVRTGGARHLRSPALNVTWYQKTYLDLIVLVTVVAAVLIYAMKYLIYKHKICKENKLKQN